MDVDSPPFDIVNNNDGDELEKQQSELKVEGKRTKWQLPPSHIRVFSSSSSSNTSVGSGKSNKFSSHNRQQPSSSVTNNQLKQQQGKHNAKSTTKMMGDNNMESNNSNGNDISLEAIAEAISTPKLIKSSIMARAEICPKIRRARLMSTKGVAAKIREQYGYDISNTTFLYAEEILYLLEMARLEVHVGRIAVGVERARALLLHSKSHPFPDSNPTKIKTCSIDEYLVYKHLSELGYRVRRRDSDVKVNISQSSLTSSRERSSPLLLPTTATDNDENMEMKACGSGMDEQLRMELDDEEESLMQQDDTAVGGEYHGEVTETIMTTSQQSLSSSSSGIGKSTTIISDGGGTACFNQPSSTTVRGTKRKFGDLSTSDQTPGSTTSSAKDMSDEEYADEEELEFIHTAADTSEGRSFKSWKEWRQGAMTEAQDVLSESLLGQYNNNAAFTTATEVDPMQKLHLWGEEKEPKCKKRADEGWRGFNIPYEIYHPSIGFAKHKNRKDCPPSYVVAVVRYDEEVPRFAACETLVNGIPVLIGVVSDESTIMFVNPDGSPIPSLF